MRGSNPKSPTTEPSNQGALGAFIKGSASDRRLGLVVKDIGAVGLRSERVVKARVVRVVVARHDSKRRIKAVMRMAMCDEATTPSTWLIAMTAAPKKR